MFTADSADRDPLGFGSVARCLSLLVIVVWLIVIAETGNAQTYAFLNNGTLVDQADEATKLRNVLNGMGVTTNTFTGLTEADFTTALTGVHGLIVPELQNGDLYASIDNNTRTLLTNFVNSGGVLFTNARGDRVSNLVNGLFGTSMASGSGGSSTLNATEAAGTVFAGGPTNLSGPSAVDGLSTASLPGSALSIYENAFGGTTVMVMPQGAGTVYYLGFDWFTVPAPADWQEVLANQLTNYWDGSTGNLWSASTNWSTEYVPIAGDTAYFNGSVNTTVNHDQASGTNYEAIVFRSGASAFTIVGNAIGVQDAGSITNNSTALQTLSVEVFADGDLTINTAAGDITFTEAIGTNTGHTVLVTGANDVSLAGLGGAGALAKTGNGTLTLVDASTHTGGTNFGGGTVVLGNNSSLSDGNVTVSANTTVQSNDDARSVDNNFAVNSGVGLTVGGADDLAIVGNITGQGSLVKTGAGTLSLTGENTYSGDTTVSAGTLAGNTDSLQGDIVNNATVEFNNSAGGLYEGTLTGSGNTNIDGTGTVYFTGDASAFTGTVTVEAGELAMATVFGGDVDVHINSRLYGTGTIDGNLTVNGILAPGTGGFGSGGEFDPDAVGSSNDIGSIAVGGNVDFSANSEFEAEVTTGGNVPGTHNDLLAAGGVVSINGGAVDVQAEPGPYVAGTQYTFITGASVTGTFDSIVDDLAFFTAQLGYTSMSVYFTLVADNTSHANVALTPNQYAVAVYFDDHSPGAAGDLLGVITAFQPLSNGQVRDALEQMGGEVYGTIQQVNIQNTSVVLHSLSEQLQPSSFAGGMSNNDLAADDVTRDLNDAEIVQVSYQPDGAMQLNRRAGRRHNTWAMGFGLGGDADSDGNAADLSYGMGGGLVGVDAHVDRGHRLGAYGGYVATGLETVRPVASSEIKGGQFGTYYTGRNGHHYYTLISGLQVDDFESERVITAGGLNRTARGDYDGWQGFGYLERGAILYSSNRWSCQPFGALQYVHVRQNSFTETGAGVLNLSIDGVDDDSFRSLLGMRIQVRTIGNRRHVTPEFRAVWVHEFMDTDLPVVARFATVGGAFTVEGLDMGRDWALVGTGLNWNLGNNWSAQANYDAQVNEHQTFHVGSGSVQKTW
jgi:autotransporter-associated beta strand protein